MRVDHDLALSSPSFTPAVSRPMPAVFGARPVAYMTWPASIVRPSFSVTFSRDQPLSMAAISALHTHVDPALEQLRGQPVAQVLVEAAQDLGAAVEKRGVDAEAVEDAGELDGDVAAADDRGWMPAGCSRWNASLEVMAWPAPGISVTTGRPPVATRMTCAVTLRLPGCTTRYARRQARHDACMPGTPALLEAATIEALEAGDLGVLVGNQRRPVEASRAATLQPKPAASSNSSRKRLA